MSIEIDIYKLAEKYNLTESEEMAFKYIVNNFEKSLEIGVRGVAKKCFASTSVVMNLSKKLGYKGFVDMVYRLEFSIKSMEAERTNINDSYSVNMDKRKLKKFKDFIIKDKRHVFIHGVGFSKSVAKYIAEKLVVLGYYAMVSEYMESMKDKYFCKGILILISKTGETSSLFPLCEKAKVAKIPIILFTGNPNSTIGEKADLTFVIKDSNPIDDRNLEKNDFFGNTILFFENLINLCLKNSEDK